MDEPLDKVRAPIRYGEKNAYGKRARNKRDRSIVHRAINLVKKER